MKNLIGFIVSLFLCLTVFSVAKAAGGGKAYRGPEEKIAAAAATEIDSEANVTSKPLSQFLALRPIPGPNPEGLRKAALHVCTILRSLGQPVGTAFMIHPGLLITTASAVKSSYNISSINAVFGAAYRAFIPSIGNNSHDRYYLQFENPSPPSEWPANFPDLAVISGEFCRKLNKIFSKSDRGPNKIILGSPNSKTQGQELRVVFHNSNIQILDIQLFGSQLTVSYQKISNQGICHENLPHDLEGMGLLPVEFTNHIGNCASGAPVLRVRHDGVYFEGVIVGKAVINGKERFVFAKTPALKELIRYSKYAALKEQARRKHCRGLLKPEGKVKLKEAIKIIDGKLKALKEYSYPRVAEEGTKVTEVNRLLLAKSPVTVAGTKRKR